MNFPFDAHPVNDMGKYYNMCSFVETRVEKVVHNKSLAAQFLEYPFLPLYVSWFQGDKGVSWFQGDRVCPGSRGIVVSQFQGDVLVPGDIGGGGGCSI